MECGIYGSWKTDKAKKGAVSNKNEKRRKSLYEYFCRILKIKGKNNLRNN